METKSNYQFCFVLNWDAKLQFYIPTSYVIEANEAINYLDKKATPEVLAGLGLELTSFDLSIQKAVAICQTLKPELIVKKFNKAGKAKKNTDDLLKDSKVVTGINLYIKNKLTEFFNLIDTHNLPLSLALDKDKDFSKSQIQTQNQPLETQLRFVKNQEGITYTLMLKAADVFFPSDKKIEILMNEPAWVVVNQQLFRLKEINAKKLKPFLNKKEIEIPTRMIPEFFDKFIKDIVKKVDIEASGFDMIQKSTIKNCRIEIIHDFIRNNYYLNLLFDYDGYVFDYSKPKKTHSEIDSSNANNLKVIQYKRTATETVFEKKLLNLGLSKTQNGYFYLQPKEPVKDPFATTQWLIEQQEMLQSMGFEVLNIALENKKLNTHKPSIRSSNSTQNDWFDIKMMVVCGDYEFNFIELIPNIKNQNRLYLMDNGSHFLIPKEWLSQYASLAKLSRIGQESLLLPKSNFTVLEEIPELAQHEDPTEAIVYTPSNLVKASLRPYQKEGVEWLLDHYNNGLGACLADDMGLGKTLQTLSVLVAVQEQLENQTNQNPQLDLFGNQMPTAKEHLKALIVLPSSLIFNWYNEAGKFTPHFSRLQYVGNNRKDLAKKISRYDLIFTSYAILSRDLAVFQKHNFRFLILDESQYIKNKNSKIFKAINQISASQKIALSGTPIENSLDDLWSQMQFINPDILGEYPFFVQHYKKPIEKQQDENALFELKKIVGPFILRRTKEQVLKDLPELSEQIYYCDMEPDQEKLYEEEKSKTRNFLLKTEGEKANTLSIINSLMLLRQLSNHPKMIDAKSEIDSGKYLAVTNYVQTLVLSKQKTIIFSSFVSNLNFYINWCKENKIKFCEITGETALKEREQAVNRFQEQEDVLIFFISLKAGGVGLNITKASYVLFLDPWWNPFAEKQGIGRAHRMGQLNKVNVIRFISKNTVEEKIIRLQESKKLLSDSLLDENNLSVDLEQNLAYLLE